MRWSIGLIALIVTVLKLADILPSSETTAQREDIAELQIIRGGSGPTLRPLPQQHHHTINNTRLITKLRQSHLKLTAKVFNILGIAQHFLSIVGASF
ncbi:MAG: hypothetical protein ACI8WB_006002 [Phenylobacterium sp.]